MHNTPAPHFRLSCHPERRAKPGVEPVRATAGRDLQSSSAQTPAPLPALRITLNGGMKQSGKGHLKLRFTLDYRRYFLASRQIKKHQSVIIPPRNISEMLSFFLPFSPFDSLFRHFTLKLVLVSCAKGIAFLKNSYCFLCTKLIDVFCKIWYNYVAISTFI